MKFKFLGVHKDYRVEDREISRITLETNEISLPDVLDEFKRFLLGCGYQVNGNIEVVDEDE